MPSLTTSKPYWFEAKLLRNGVRVTKQGSFSATSDIVALDTVYDMSKRWGAPMLSVMVYEMVNGSLEMVAQSTVGSLPSRNRQDEILREEKEDAANDEETAYAEMGYPIYNTNYDNNQFWPAQIGSYFQEGTYAILKLPETEGS